jgi:hypothetical protein
MNYYWFEVNNDGNARRYYQCSRWVFIYLFDILIRIHSFYIINTYIPLIDRVNSMVMSEKLKRSLVEALKRTAANL